MSGQDTIVALASGQLPAGIAILRFSGESCAKILAKLVKNPPKYRQLRLRQLRDPETGGILDAGLVVLFPGPDSFTGEDCLEFHLHGSVAVVKRVLNLCVGMRGVRLAQPGEFTRRAFENGQLDLLEVEGLGDLISAQTERQRVQAIGRMKGGLSGHIESWRARLVDISVKLEVQLDFADEGDVGVLDQRELVRELVALRSEMAATADTFEQGRIVREGFRVALGGPPNVGKSSIINQLANSPVAIVTAEAGTTRDVREVLVDLDGQLVIFIDSAGLRDSSSEAEKEGVRRTRQVLRQCDLILWVASGDVHTDEEVPDLGIEVVRVANKADLVPLAGFDLSVSCKTGDGFEALRRTVLSKIKHSGEGVLVSRLRDRRALESGIESLDRAVECLSGDIETIGVELVAEEVRHARVDLEHLLGKIGSEDILDRLFCGFCIGK